MNKKITLILLCATFLISDAFAQRKLIATSHTKGAARIVEDSVIYRHSANSANAGKFNIPEYEYMEDEKIVYGLDGSNLVPKTKTNVTYNNAEFQESITQKWENGAWENDEKVTMVFKNGKPDTVTVESWSTFGGNSSWRRSERFYYTWSGDNFATKTRQRYSFGGGGSPPGWRNSRMWTASYGTQGMTSIVEAKWDNGMWEDTSKKTITYDAVLNNISQILYQVWGTFAWESKSKDDYTLYNPSGLVSQIITSLFDGTNWNEYKKLVYHYVDPNDATSAPDSIIHSEINLPPNYANVYKHIIKSDPVDKKMLQDSVMSWNGIDKWVYESFDTSNNWYWGWNVNVETVKDNNQDNITVYPSPASNQITINLEGIRNESDFHFTIIDIQGRTVKSWSETAVDKTTISINDLPAGSYMLHVRSDNRFEVERFVVSK